MKKFIILKEFSALSFDAGMIATAPAPADSCSQPQRMPSIVRRFVGRQPGRAEKFRDMVRRREVTPLANKISHHRFGINE